MVDSSETDNDEHAALSRSRHDRLVYWSQTKVNTHPPDSPGTTARLSYPVNMSTIRTAITRLLGITANDPTVNL